MNKRMMRRLAARGFTLIELLLVLVILTALAAIVVPKFAKRGEQAKVTQAVSQIASFQTALEAYEVDNGQYPTGDQGLQALVVAPASATNWKGPYLTKSTIPDDPWGRPYIYVCPGVNNPNGFDIHSTGPSGQEGADDNIDNWSPASSSRGSAAISRVETFAWGRPRTPLGSCGTSQG